jgi:endonuclease-3 related protein
LEREQIEICIGAILTQNTAWTNVEKALGNLNRAGLVDFNRIQRVSAETLAQCIRPSGYYNQKAKRLKEFAANFCSKYRGGMVPFFQRPLAAVREELLSLSGIGPETADSMLLYAGGKTTFVVDAYTCRLGMRLGWFRTDTYDEIQQYFQAHLPCSRKVYNEYHALIVALGKNYCRKKPLCTHCPLYHGCRYPEKG